MSPNNENELASANPVNSPAATSASKAAVSVPELKAKAGKLWQLFLSAGKPVQYGVGGGAALLLFIFLFSGGEGEDSGERVTFETRRGELAITVLEGGSLEALQSTEYRSRVRGREGTKILSIVEEGYRVTPEDVQAGKILVELDTDSLVDQQLNQEISVETAEASYIERKAQYEIQLNENMTELNDARQGMKFAKLDFEKFLGANIVEEIVRQLQIEERLAKAEEAELNRNLVPDSAPAAPERGRRGRGGPPEGFDPTDLSSMPPQMRERMEQLMAENGGAIPAEVLERMQRGRAGGGNAAGPRGGFGQGGGRPGFDTAAVEAEPVEELTLQPLELDNMEVVAQLLMDESYMTVRNTLDFTQYANIDILEDGEAKQQLRSLQDAVQEAEEEFLLAQDRVEGQRRLESRGFITPTELEAEELNLSKASNKKEEKATALRLYIQYTFPKDAEEKLADYENAVMGFQRQLKENVAEQAQEAARFKSAERKFNLERTKLSDLNEQIELATIRAERPGLVVYGGSDTNSSRYRGGSSQEAIQEGATVRERQPILTIPDMREMAVKVNIHESAVQRVAVGQIVNVTVDAFSDIKLTGEVTKVAVVADSANAFLNPDLKVYPTTVKIHGTHDWLRPGMSAQVEILVDTLEDATYVPLQAVTYWDDQQVVYVVRGRGAERREVEVGTFSEQFIEILSGLAPGEEVLLLPPQQGLEDVSTTL